MWCARIDRHGRARARVHIGRGVAQVGGYYYGGHTRTLIIIVYTSYGYDIATTLILSAFDAISLVDDSLPNLTRGRRLKNKYTHTHTHHVISLSVRNGQRFLVSFLYSSSEETLIKTKYLFDFRHRCLLLYSHKFVLFTNFSRRIIIIVVSTCTRDEVTRSYTI